MKKLALAFMSASALLFGLGAVASAQGYDESLTTNPSPPVAGGAYDAVYSNCVVGELITFNQPQSTPATVTGTCVSNALTGSVLGLLLPQQAALGNATGTFTAAPTAGGNYTITASGPISPVQTISFTIAGTTPTVPATTPGGGLPATGSDGIGTTTNIAIGLFVVGLGLFVVAQVRRRQPSVA